MPRTRTTTPAATRRSQPKPHDPLGQTGGGTSSAAQRNVEAFRRQHEADDARGLLDVDQAVSHGSTPSMARRPRTGTAPPPRPDGGAGGAVSD